ncbi:MAG: deoxyguanosinetriphosphate triphosphohydrolase [Proteobacteria bacterium]|nr:deoxyguanosinetriphosphate triphosphohydrolase [Pseudomonadota bacterium]
MTAAYPHALAVYACRPEESRGRLHPEPESPTRSPFQRDRDRIIHSGAFRKLTYKTQVFVYHEGDYYRTRLSHSLEVAQIARSIGRALGLNEDLAEALALGHDLGHTPFGHAGEEALDKAMAPFGGFDHNAQSLRIVTALEHRYAEFDGLNLSWETLEGLVKHNGPLIGPNRTPGEGPERVHAIIADYAARRDLGLATFASAEAQVAALSDDIAYTNHDIDDGVRAGLFGLDDLAAAVPAVGRFVAALRRRYPGIEPSRLVHETVRRLIDLMVTDLLGETRARLARAKPASADEVRAMGRPVAGFSEPLNEELRRLRDFLFRHMYRHYKVNRMTSKARRVVEELFRLLLAEPACLPTEWQAGTGAPGSAETARVVADYIAGMTDRYALAEHRRLFDLQAKHD